MIDWIKSFPNEIDLQITGSFHITEMIPFLSHYSIKRATNLWQSSRSDSSSLFYCCGPTYQTNSSQIRYWNGFTEPFSTSIPGPFTTAPFSIRFTLQSVLPKLLIRPAPQNASSASTAVTSSNTKHAIKTEPPKPNQYHSKQARPYLTIQPRCNTENGIAYFAAFLL